MLEKIARLFRPVESVEADQVRSYISEHPEGSFTLLDVRQHGEYESGHLPGAKLIPLPELADSYDKLDRDKPVIVY